LAGAYRFQARCDLICRAPADALIYIEEILNRLDLDALVDSLPPIAHRRCSAERASACDALCQMSRYTHSWPQELSRDR
jgi:hypothetical protein